MCQAILLCKTKNNFCSLFADKEQMEKIQKNNKIFFDFQYAQNFKEEDCIDFKKNPSYKLDDNQIFFIDYSDYEDIKSSVSQIATVLNNTGDYQTIQKEQLSEIQFFFCGYCEEKNKTNINIQIATRSTYIRHKNILALQDSGIKYRNEEDIIQFGDVCDIHINQEELRIYFKNFNHLKKFDSKSVSLYQEAKEEQSKDFICKINSLDIFDIQCKIEDIKERNLKAISYLLDENRLDNFLSSDKELINNYIDTFSNAIKFKKNADRLIIENNTDFTNMIKIINENFYTCAITHKKKESNSSREV